MKKILFLISFLCLGLISFSQMADKEKEPVLQMLRLQQDAWNKGDIDGFMQTYVHSDSLQFVGKDITYGWQNTLERYKKAYPSKEAMGTLTFSDLKADLLSDKTAFVIGAWKIIRSDTTELGGHFTLLLKKIDGKWLIVVDHTS